VRELQRQAAELEAREKGFFRYEIVVVDDGSTDKSTILQNEAISTLPCTRFIKREKNIGRAFSRNELIDGAKYNLVLLIDSDAEVCTTDFIARYWQNRDAAAVVCGSLRNPAGPCPKGHELRWRYEKKNERWRQKYSLNEHPYFRLTTFNLMLNREQIGPSMRFDKHCSEYGYEDSLFGLTLAQEHIPIVHIDNPLIHTGIDSNEEFLEKTEAGMRTLYRLQDFTPEFTGTMRVHNALKLLRLLKLFRATFRLLRPLIHYNLLSHHPSITLFQFYKLGYFSLLNEKPTDVVV